MFRNGLEPWHVILVVVVFILLFGYKKLPDAARGLGKSLRILKSETRALREEHGDATGQGGGRAGAAEPQRPEELEKGTAPRPEQAAESAKNEQPAP